LSAFVKTSTIQSGTGAGAVAYLFAQGQNESVEFISGDKDALILEDAIAVQDNAKFSLVHAIYTSDTRLTPEQLTHIRQAARTELGVPLDAHSLLVKHSKIGKDGVQRDHHHELFPGRDEAGKVINTYRSKKRDELVSRMCEVDFGMSLVPGKHNDFVYKVAQERNLDKKYQDAFKEISNISAVAAYSSKNNSIADRVDFNIGKWNSGLKDIAKLTNDQKPEALAELMNKFDNAEIISSNRSKARIVVSFNAGEFIQNANRVLKINKNDTKKFIATTKEKYDELRRRETRGLSRAERAKDEISAGKQNFEQKDEHRSPDKKRHNRDLGASTTEGKYGRSSARATRRDDKNNNTSRKESRQDNAKSALDLVQRQIHHKKYDDLTLRLKSLNKENTATQTKTTFVQRLRRFYLVDKISSLLETLKVHNNKNRGLSDHIIRQRQDLTDKIKPIINELKAHNNKNKGMSELDIRQRQDLAAELAPILQELKSHNTQTRGVSDYELRQRQELANDIAPILQELKSHNSKDSSDDSISVDTAKVEHPSPTSKSKSKQSKVGGSGGSKSSGSSVSANSVVLIDNKSDATDQLRRFFSSHERAAKERASREQEATITLKYKPPSLKKLTKSSFESRFSISKKDKLKDDIDQTIAPRLDR
jgi:hypothetical protein